jgi:proteasome component ECM29
LPLRDLRDLFINPSLNAFQKNFSLIYLEMAFNRAPVEDQQETTALLYNQISALPAAQQDIILHMTTQVLHNFKIPQDKLQRQAAFMFTHSAKDKAIILNYWLDLLMLVIPSMKEVLENPSFLAPGLSANAQKRVKGKIAWTYDTLAKVKENVVDFLISIGDLFASEEIFIHFAIAASDNINAVARKGEDGVRKYFVAKDLEDKEVVDKLFKLFLGTQKTEQVAEEKRSPVSYNVKMKILEYLNRSTFATNNFPASLQLIFEALFGTESSSRMRQVAISFVQWVLRMADDKYIQMMAPILFSGLLKLLAALKQPEAQEALTSQLRGSTYSAIGALSKKAPQLFASNVQLLEEFFQDTSTEEPTVRVYIQEALTHMCTAYLPVIESNPEVKAKVEAILLSNAEKGDSQSRYLSVYYTNRLFVYQHVPARYINLLLSNDTRSDVREESHRSLKPYKRNDRDVIADETQKWPDFEGNRSDENLIQTTNPCNRFVLLYS